jgi:hypothetical protein
MPRLAVVQSVVMGVALGVAGCASPRVARDGTLVFQEEGAGSAAVLTANGLEIRDTRSMPSPIVRRDANEPWRAPLGFILPRDGRFTRTSVPTVIATTGLAIVLRPSDTRVPSWGGEVLVRVDVIAPAAEGEARWGENIALVVDGRGPDTALLVAAALDQLAGRDRVTIFDARGPRLIVPLMPASNRALVLGALEKRQGERADGESEKRDVGSALEKSAAAIASTGPESVTQRVLLLSAPSARGVEADAVTVLARLAGRGVQVGTIATGPQDGADLAARTERLRALVPSAGQTTFRGVRLRFEGTPAPSHVLEASGAHVLWRLDAGDVVLGDVRAGEARTEVLRVSVPPWSAGNDFHFTVTAEADDLAWGGPRSFRADVPCTYDDDIERIARSRHGDVITYASALATLKRLDQAFTSEGVARAGSLHQLAVLHARSMQDLARDTHDHAIQEQADMIAALLSASR